MSKMWEVIKSIAVSMFCRRGRVHAPYIYIWMLLVLVAAAIGRKVVVGSLSDEMVLGLCTFIAVWVGLLKIPDKKE